MGVKLEMQCHIHIYLNYKADKFIYQFECGNLYNYQSDIKIVFVFDRAIIRLFSITLPPIGAKDVLNFFSFPANEVAGTANLHII